MISGSTSTMFIGQAQGQQNIQTAKLLQSKMGELTNCLSQFHTLMKDISQQNFGISSESLSSNSLK